MEFEELKVEIPVDNDEEEEKDFPFNLVSKSKVIFFYRIYNFLEHLSIFYVVFCVTGKTIWKQVGLFRDRIWRNF